MSLDNDLLLKWWYNKSKNPFTSRTIKKSGRIWKKYLNTVLINNIIKDPYHKFHNNLIDPLTMIQINKDDSFYKYEYCWDPLNGSLLGKDPRGPLYFDPDILIHYFYTKRLDHLWIESNDGYSGTYGDGVGNGPEFFINGRGFSHHWYLFRLPLHDAYCSIKNMGQQTTMGPILNLLEIKKIYNLAKKNKNNYFELFCTNRPNLEILYDIYHQAIQKPVTIDNGFDDSLVKESYLIMNQIAVNNLKNL